ncbi:MmyB family transcriptional regulator [Nocardia niigatensis]|uniref:MmyB family transcriptional regulator n=1 Tax=Nocardia niigatensis TaxID=209249 RepID=UPI000684795E|nr:helix-turn-helix domain-containing protein [Nocardia niigatensis]
MAVKANRDHDSKALRLPTFGVELRRLREDRHLSRERLAFATGVSASYVSHLEGGERAHPTRDVVEALLRYLQRVKPIPASEQRYLLELVARPPAGVSAEPEVIDPRTLLTPQLLSVLSAHEPNLAAFIDHHGNVLACNSSYAQAFPGLHADANLLRWLLHDPRSREALPDWEQECTLMIRCARTSAARDADTAWAKQLFATFGNDQLFVKVWNDGEIAYNREPAPMRLRDAWTGSVKTVQAHTWLVPGPGMRDRVQIFVGMWMPPPAEAVPRAADQSRSQLSNLLRCERAQWLSGGAVFLGWPRNTATSD